MTLAQLLENEIGDSQHDLSFPMVSMPAWLRLLQGLLQAFVAFLGFSVLTTKAAWVREKVFSASGQRCRILGPVEVSNFTVHNHWHSHSGFECMGTYFYPACPHAWLEGPCKENDLSFFTYIRKTVGQGRGIFPLIVYCYIMEATSLQGSDLFDPLGEGGLEALSKQSVMRRWKIIRSKLSYD